MPLVKYADLSPWHQHYISRLERLAGLRMTAEELRTIAFELSPADQFRIATQIAANVGYILAPEPEIDPPLDDSPTERA